MTTNASACAAMTALLLAAAATALPDVATAETLRNPLRIDVPDQPRLPNTTQPVLYMCAAMDDCQSQAADFCETFNYPNGRILFRDLPRAPRPFPIYSVICFD